MNDDPKSVAQPPRDEENESYYLRHTKDEIRRIALDSEVVVSVRIRCLQDSRNYIESFLELFGEPEAIAEPPRLCAHPPQGDRLGQRLRDLRQLRGLSLDRLAILSGVSKGYLWKLEKKLNPNPSLSTLVRLAKALELPAWEVVYHLAKGDGGASLAEAAPC